MISHENSMGAHLAYLIDGQVCEKPVTVGPESLDFDFNDPEGIKDERVVLGSVIGTRVLMRAMDSLESEREVLQQPAIESLDTAAIPFEDKLDLLSKKLNKIRMGLLREMSKGMLAEEGHIATLPDEHILSRIYKRLDHIVSPAITPEDLETDVDVLQGMGFDVHAMSPVWIHTLRGFPPLCQNIENMITHVPFVFEKKAKRQPSMREITTIIDDSFPSHVGKVAASHQAALAEMGFPINHTTTQIVGTSYSLMPERARQLREANLREYPSSKTGCALLIPFERLKPLLDPNRKIPPYPNPLFAGHKYVARILAA